MQRTHIRVESKEEEEKEYVYVGGYIQRFENRAAHLHEMWLGYKKRDGPPDLAKPPKAPPAHLLKKGSFAACYCNCLTEATNKHITEPRENLRSLLHPLYNKKFYRSPPDPTIRTLFLPSDRTGVMLPLLWDSRI